MANQSPPQPPPNFAHSGDSLIRLANELVSCKKKLTDTVAESICASEATFANVLLPLAQGRNDMALGKNIIGFLGSVSADPKIREASTLAKKTLSDYDIETSMREDVFLLVKNIYEKQKDDATLDEESRLLIEKEYNASMRMGLNLAAPARKRFQEIQKRLPELYIAFGNNLSEERGGLWLTPEELNGVPDDVLQTLARGEQGSPNEGKLRLTFKYPDFYPTQKYCTVAETRKRVFLANENKCNHNMELLQEALVLRDEAARLLGYPDHATFVLEERMAKSPKTVNDFLNDLRERLTSGAQAELAKLCELKRVDTDDTDAGRYFFWDHAYYHTLMLERDFQVDQTKISEYFPLEACISGMLNIFKELLGLSFLKIDGADRDAISETGNGDDTVWHPDVQLFSVWNDGKDSDDLDFVGYLYFDLHPREGKFAHAANFNLQPGFVTPDGSGRRFPATALICNFSKPTATKPSLLKHGEVVTLFHELGHGIHNLVSQTLYGRFHGTNTTRDFVEAPSQMLENWCWISSQIKALSRHWSYLSADYEKAFFDSASGTGVVQPAEKMPEDMIESLIRTRHVNDALLNLRSVHFSIFDMVIHQPESHEHAVNMDVSKLFNKLRHDICLLDDLGDTDQYRWANGAAILGHVMGGYDAGLYGYLWSEVYATDMFDAGFSQDPMNREAGNRYRNSVLKHGGSREPIELLKTFLGREPSTEAFYKQLGIV